MEKSSIDFEAAIQELNELVQKMESGELSLEQSLQEFERGVRLTNLCQIALKDAEQRVAVLTVEGEEQALTDLDVGGDE